MSDSERTRELEVELRRVRAAAAAARFEARAAEIELLLRRMARQTPSASSGTTAPRDSSPTEHLPIDSWQQLLHAASLWQQPEEWHRSEERQQPEERQRPEERQQPEERQRLASFNDPILGDASPHGERAELEKPPVVGDQGRAMQPEADRERWLEPQFQSSAPAAESLDEVRAAFEESSGTEQQTDEPARRKRPAPWIISTLAHAAILLLLAATTISIAEPKDQIALQATTPRANEPRLEAVSLEQVDQPEETAPQTPLQMMADTSPIGDIAASEFEIDAPELTAPPSPSLDSLNQLLSSVNPLSAEGSPELNSQFFGIQGGGNHFVYLVDNSGSMASIARNGFDVAREELLKSVAALRQDQRFYVIFFGEKMLRMRISDPSAPEPRSVYATAENKASLRRWAMGITMQRGRWPEKPLQFAFQLRPDVIFLLTDGEMSQKVEPMIREHNLVESLFDGPRPRSIIHTIGFYSRDGAEQMQKIAEVNGGTYRFIPPPRRR